MKQYLLRWLYFFDRKERRYVSETDRFLQAFQAQNPALSASQIQEVKKHADVFNRPRLGL